MRFPYPRGMQKMRGHSRAAAGAAMAIRCRFVAWNVMARPTFQAAPPECYSPRMLTLPNILTLSRIVTVPLLAAFLWWPEWELGYGIAFAIYALMGVTDYFDGYLARSQGTVSKLGVFLDPIADKIMVAAVILLLVGKQVIPGIHIIPALVILMREIAVSGLREF